jgi:CRISPR-associated protein Cmr1
MQTITFYSYKGGVGRTLALANVAMLLAEMGKRVFVLDCDLEAPGMHYKLLDEARRAEVRQGFVDLSYEYFEKHCFKPIAEYVKKIERGKGEILLMSAGQPLFADYWNKLVKIRWPDRFYEEYGEGFAFLLELKRRIEEEFIEEERKLDVLLIDARTGVTEVGGAALTLLPDKVVFLFVNNGESKEGTREIIRSIARTLPEGDKLPDVVPVLTRIPEDMPHERERLTVYFNEAPDDVKPLLVRRVLLLRSDADLEREEALLLAQRGNRDRVLYRDYVELFRALELVDPSELAQYEILALQQEAGEAFARGKTDDAMRSGLEAVELAERSFGTLDARHADALYAYAHTARKAARYEEALDAFRRLEGHYLKIDSVGAPRLAEVAGALVLISAQMGRFDDVRTAMAKAIPHHRELGDDHLIGLLGELSDLYETSRGKDHPSYGQVLRERWSALFAAQRDDAANDVLTQAINHFQSLGDEGQLDLADAQHALARLHMRKGDLGPAIAELREVEKTYWLLLGAEDPKWRQVQAELADAVKTLELEKGTMAAPDKIDASRSRVAPPETLPTRRPRAVRGGPEIAWFSVHLSVVTPIMGGAARTRDTDTVDVIRVPSLRGQLRFWWRALYGGKLAGQALYAAERRLWGGAADEDDGRSAVEIRVTVETKGEVDQSPIRPFGRDATQGAYALWPAREARGANPQPTASRRAPGTRFVLEVRCPVGDENAVRNTVRALILFGGYGSRTRRGAGTFTVAREADRAAWLPAEARREALAAVFGDDVLTALAQRPLDDLPLLRGAGLRVGRPVLDAAMAWTTALDWLNAFRQGQPQAGALGSMDARFARVRGDQQRPGRSNWPEADKVRRISGRGPWAHDPLATHGNGLAWPRAGFGLPIVAQFQRKDRNGAYYSRPEPDNYELRWHEQVGKENVEHDRLASPLIVKALPLADGRFAPCALWLYRGYPNGNVGLKAADPRSQRSRATFDVLVAPGDKAMFAPLDAGKNEPVGTRLRAAFFDWLAQRPGIVVVAP